MTQEQYSSVSFSEKSVRKDVYPRVLVRVLSVTLIDSGVFGEV
jgi:hypothetical protein